MLMSFAACSNTARDMKNKCFSGACAIRRLWTKERVNFRLPRVNHGGLDNVERVRRLQFKKKMHYEIAPMPKTTLWY